MIRTVLTSQTNDLHLILPQEYVGKEIEVTYIPIEEISDLSNKSKSISKFRGALNLSKDKLEEFQQFIQDGRNEWETRNI